MIAVFNSDYLAATFSLRPVGLCPQVEVHHGTTAGFDVDVLIPPTKRAARDGFAATGSPNCIRTVL